MEKKIIPKRANPRAAPLSVAQQRLWLLDQFEPNSPRYNCARALRLRGPLDVSALRASLDQVVSRHETLRSTYHESNGMPVQIIGDPVPASVVFVDFRDQGPRVADRMLTEFIIEQVGRPYNLAADAMLRGGLVRLSPSDHVLLYILPHIVTDGWSLIVLSRELFAHYDGMVRGRLGALADLPIQYADFAAWQRHWLQGQEFENQLTYWRKTLAGLSQLELPHDRVRPTLPSRRNLTQTTKLPQVFSNQLIGLAQQQRATLFMTLLAAFYTLLFRYTGQDDIAVGSPIAHRPSAELEGLIGLFANTLVLRTSLAGNPSFSELLARVREVALRAYAHQDLPFESLVGDYKPESDLRRNRLVQVSFQLRSYPRELVQIADLTVEPFELSTGIAKFDLAVAMANEADGLKVEVEYNPDIFERATIERILDHVRILLEWIVTNPNGRISDLSALGEPKKRQPLDSWNETSMIVKNVEAKLF